MSTAPFSTPRELPEPAKARFTPLRAGLQNVWEYDERRFVLEHGRLMLRGRNEAGKTKALELLFPFLLDADLSPQRLDPFGSAARPMRWNLLNDATGDVQQRIGYVWLELGRRPEDGNGAEFVTLGAGLRARRGVPDVDAWFFVTSQRLDRDLDLLGDDRRPRARADLVEAIGEAGHVYERQADYRRAVNARLFGFGDDQYAALVDTLLHLRRPQLSRSLDLPELSRFLSQSLPPLEARVLAPIAEGFERLDHHRAELENLGRTLDTLRGFEDVYREYARALAKGRAQELTRAESAYARARGEAREVTALREELSAAQAGLAAQVEALDVEERTLLARARALESSEAYQAARALDDVEAAAAGAAERSAAAERRREADARSAREAKARQGAAASELASCQGEAERAAEEARGLAERAAFAAEHFALDRLASAEQVEALDVAFATLRAERERALTELRDLARRLAAAEERHRRAEERARDCELARDDARAALERAEEVERSAREDFAAALEHWVDRLEVLTPAPEEALRRDDAGGSGVAAAEPTPRQSDQGDDQNRTRLGVQLGLQLNALAPGLVRAAVIDLAEPVRASLAAARAEALALVARLTGERDLVVSEREALARASHPAPAPPAWRAARPPERPGAPLYLACDFVGGEARDETGGVGVGGEGDRDAGFQGALEGALEAAGLLDAWVEPDGTLVHPRAGDVTLQGPPVEGRSLADVLAPVEAGAVTREAALRALRAVGFARAGEDPEGACWVAADGRFRLGALRGAHRKGEAAYLGATARERERARRLAELAARAAALEEELSGAKARARAAEESQRRLGEELAALPSPEAALAAAAAVVVRGEALGHAQERLTQAEHAAAGAAEARSGAAAALDGAAAAHGLSAFGRDPEGLAERTGAYAGSVHRLVFTVRTLGRARAAEAAEGARAAEAAERAEGSAGEARRRGEEAAASRALAERAPRGRRGRGADGGGRGIGQARARAEAARSERAARAGERSAVDERLGAARTAAQVAEAAVEAREGERKQQAEAFRALAGAGLLLAASLPVESADDLSSFTAALEAARRVDAAVERGATPEEREAVENRLARRQADLQRDLPAEVRVLSSRSAGILSFELTWERPDPPRPRGGRGNRGRDRGAGRASGGRGEPAGGGVPLRRGPRAPRGAPARGERPGPPHERGAGQAEHRLGRPGAARLVDRPGARRRAGGAGALPAGRAPPQRGQPPVAAHLPALIGDRPMCGFRRRL